MELSQVLMALRDPMGIPFFPWLFQGLMVLTFALHILVVNLAVGGLCLAVYFHYRGGDYQRRLSAALARVVTVSLSLAIVLGVAPLLFIQVIYDPFWYTSTSLSAWWTMAFLLFITLAFLAAYVFYLRRRRQPGGYVVYGGAALVLLVFAGVIMSVLALQLLQPDQWRSWYWRQGTLNTLGNGLYAFKLGRFLHFLVPSLVNAGIFLMLYAWYFQPRADLDSRYRHWVGRVGARVAKIAAMVQVAVGCWWLLTVPAELGFLTDPFLLGGAALGFLLLFLLLKGQHQPERYALPAASLSLLAVLGMATAREVLRMRYLGRFDYSIYSYPVHLDLGSTGLFLATFVMGLVVIAYPLILAFKLGRGQLRPEKEV